MAVITVPRPLREKLGDVATESLAEMLRQVRAEQRDDLFSMLEDRFARRLAETRDTLRSEMHAGSLHLQEQIGNFQADVQKQIGSVQAEIGTVRGEMGSMQAALQKEIGTVRGEMGSMQAALQKEIGTVRGEMGSMQAALQKEIGTVQAEIGTVRGEMGSMQAALQKEIARVHEKMADTHKQIALQTRWLLTAILAASVLIPVVQNVAEKLLP